MSAQWTPGPWQVEEDDCLFKCSFVPVADANGVYLAEVTGTSEDPSEITDTDRANARLIAAAPALYEDAEFLCARLRELENELNDDEVARQFYGHVTPALAGLEATLKLARGEA